MATAVAADTAIDSEKCNRVSAFTKRID
jgi:hypothetical protein